VKRILVVYFTGFAGAVALFALYAALGPDAGTLGWAVPIWRLLLFATGAACAITTWGAGVWAATVHRTAWPLALAVGAVCTATASIILRHTLGV
jgi:hypothetical protein